MPRLEPSNFSISQDLIPEQVRASKATASTSQSSRFKGHCTRTRPKLCNSLPSTEAATIQPIGDTGFPSRRNSYFLLLTLGLQSADWRSIPFILSSHYLLVERCATFTSYLDQVESLEHAGTVRDSSPEPIAPVGCRRSVMSERS